MSLTVIDLAARGRRPAPAAPAPPVRVPTAKPEVRYVFAGAQQNRLTKDFFDQWMSGRQELKYELRTLRLRSREIYRNTSIGQRYCGLCDENILGHEGMRLQMRAMHGEELDEETNSQVEAAWDDWGKRGTCTLDGRYSWREFESAVLEHVARDGEALVELVEGAKNAYGFAVQLIDVDRLNESLTRYGENIVVQGIEVDPYNRAVAYHLWTDHPMEPGAPRRSIRVEANRILHIGRHRRVGQVRYEPWLTPVMMLIKMLEEYLFTELVGARVGAGQMGIIIPGEDDQGPDPDIDPSEQEVTFEAEPGMIKRLAPGETFQEYKPTHPGEQFGDMVATIYRAIASGLHVSAAALSGNLSDVNYSSARFGGLSERDRWRVLQAWFRSSLHQCVFSAALPWFVLSKQVRLPGPWQDYAAVATWPGRGWATTDPQKDGEATANAIAMGLTDIITACNEQGRDFEEVMKNQARAQDIAKRYGVTLTFTKPAATAPGAAPPTPAPTPEPEEVTTP